MHMEKPPPNPAKLLSAWMEWERGENPPGRVLADLKIAGMRELLEELVAASAPVESAGDGEPPSAEAWSPVV